MNLRRIAHLLAVAADHLAELAEFHIAQMIADIAAIVAVFGDLPVADLIHMRVVADDRQKRRAKTLRGFHIKRGHAEGAVAVEAHHLLLRMHQFGGHRESGADSERAERTRIHPLPRPPRAHRLSRDRDDVAAVADVDGVFA